MSLALLAPVLEGVQELRVHSCQASQVFGIDLMSPRFSPAVVFGCCLLPSMVGRSSFHLGLRARQPLQTQRVLCRGSAFSSHLRRIFLPGTSVNKGSRSPDSCAPTAPALSHLVLELSLCVSPTT